MAASELVGFGMAFGERDEAVPFELILLDSRLFIKADKDH